MAPYLTIRCHLCIIMCMDTYITPQRITKMVWSEDGTFVQAWLLDEDCETPVAFIKMMHHERDLELCDVEVREEYRGQRIGVAFIRAMGEYFGQEVIHSDALYTESGMRSIAPMFAKQHRNKKFSYPLSPMHFVKDWDNFTALFKI